MKRTSDSERSLVDREEELSSMAMPSLTSLKALWSMEILNDQRVLVQMIWHIATGTFYKVWGFYLLHGLRGT